MTKEKLISFILDNIEGGYYHPNMKPYLVNGNRMGNSGETMFGLDRLNGGNDITASEAGKKFWFLVDSAYSNHHNDIRYYNDKADGTNDIPATIGTQLRKIVNEIILTRFYKYSDSYFSDAAKKIIYRNPALTLQFLYACWNGAGNFKTFANVVNNAIAQGITDNTTLYNLVKQARIAKGNLFAIGAAKLDAIVNNNNLLHNTNPLLWSVLGVLLFYGLFKLYKK